MSLPDMFFAISVAYLDWTAVEINEKFRPRVRSLSVSVNNPLHSRTVIVFTYDFFFFR